jgi:hypothetical protein
MKVETIRAMLEESARLNWPWERLVLHGGESALHPQFDELCQALQHYQRHQNPSVKNYLCTSGWSKKIQDQMKVAEARGIIIANSRKDGSDFPPSHIPLSVSPVDLGEDYHLGCFQSSDCGIAFTNQGFYECSPAAAAYRVFGYEPMVKELKDLTAEKLAEGFAKHCSTCGYARIFKLRGNKEAPEGSAERSLFYADLNAQANPHAPLSETWRKATEAYKARKKT